MLFGLTNSQRSNIVLVLGFHSHLHRSYLNTDTDIDRHTQTHRQTDTQTHTDTALSSRCYFLWQISNFIDCKQMRYHVLWIVTCFMLHWKLSLCPVSNLDIVFLADWAGTVVRCLVSFQNFLLAIHRLCHAHVACFHPMAGAKSNLWAIAHVT